MAPFFPVYVRRSDGKLAVGRPPEKNEPLPEQLLPSDDARPQGSAGKESYRYCPPGHAKEVDWRRKLAGMLVREVGTPDMQDKNYILAALPENYRLFEHIRARSEGDSKAKSHAGGGNERQDAYLYGFPQGRKKRFRSPADFFPHLLWLATDESGDANNCTCRFCSPEEIALASEQEVRKPAAKLAEVRPVAPARQTSVTSLAKARNAEQKIDLEPGKFLYRSAEIVWFQRGQSWGLGVVQQRFALAGQTGTRFHYRVQPLSNPLNYPAVVNLGQEQLRNWLAWSPPPCIAADLNANDATGTKAMTFDQVDWRQYMTTRPTADAEVDGSILAAKGAESTFTLAELLDSKTSTSASSQTSEKYWNCIYLGAEKIWLGDALRLREGPGSDVLVLHGIVERQHPTDASRTAYLFAGDTYTPASAASAAAVPPDDAIPARMRADAAAKTALAATSPVAETRGRVHYWQLKTRAVTVAFSEVKGRWYESALVLPIIAPHEYAAGKLRGELPDAGPYMNGHGDCHRVVAEPGAAGAAGGTLSHRAAWIRCRRREEAFGRGVPPLFKVLETQQQGLAAPSAGPARAAGGGQAVLAPAPAR